MTSMAPTKRQYRMSARAKAAAETAERLLAAAWRHFSASPYEQVRLSDIAAEADVSLQTLHTHFGTKEQLFVASYEWWWTGPAGSWLHSAPVGDIEGTVHVLLAHADEHGPAIMRLLSEEDNIPAVRERMDAGRVFHREWVTKTFAPQLAGLEGAARERRLARLIVATDIFTWKRLRQDMQLPRATVEQIVIEIIDPSKGTH
jgi:AcrR family transcriptional regulator